MKLVDIKKEPMANKEKTLFRLRKLIELVESDSIQSIGFFHVESGDKNGFSATLDGLPTRNADLLNLAMASRLVKFAHESVDEFIDYFVENFPVETD